MCGCGQSAVMASCNLSLARKCEYNVAERTCPPVYETVWAVRGGVVGDV